MSKRKKGLWTSAALMESLSAGEITLSEKTVIALIEGLTKKGKACYATNTWFASHVHCTKAWTSRIISSLVIRGILLTKTVKREYKSDQRLLCTSWNLPRNWKSITSSAIVIPPCWSNNTPLLVKQHPPVGQTIGDKKRIIEENNEKEIIERKKAVTCVTAARKNQSSLFDLKRARVLRSIRKVGKPNAQVDLNYYANQMRLLRTIDLKGDSKRLDNVFQWFCTHRKDKWTPQATTAKTFREKFGQIEKAMKRWQEKEGIDGDSLKITKETNDIVARITKYYDWPKGSDANLAVMVQRAIPRMK